MGVLPYSFTLVGNAPFIQMVIFKTGYGHEAGTSKEGKMKTFLIFGKSSSQELKEISLKYRAEVVSLVNDFGGNVRSMYIMLRERYLVLIFTFPGIKTAMSASIALSKLTGISFTTLPAVPIDEFNNIVT